jgi:hypothetical protein
VRRLLFLTLLLGVASISCADRLITIPLGRKIPFQNFKLDSFMDLAHGRAWDRFLGVGVSPEIEVDYHGERIDGGQMRDSFDFSYNYVPPILNQSPGISVGVLDALNRTNDHRKLYLAATWRMAVDNIGNGNIPMDATLGISYGRQTLPFVGVSAPFTENLRLLVEDDGVRIAAGLELRTLSNHLGLRAFVRGQSVMVGASLTMRF